MATPVTITNSVPYQDLQGNYLINGYLTFDLSGPAAITSGGGVAAPARVIVELDDSGNIPANTMMYATDQLTGLSALTYRYRVFNSTDSLMSDYGQVAITGSSPIDLSALTPNA